MGGWVGGWVVYLDVFVEGLAEGAGAGHVKHEVGPLALVGGDDTDLGGWVGGWVIGRWRRTRRSE